MMRKSLHLSIFSILLVFLISSCAPTKTEDGNAITLSSFKLSDLSGNPIEPSTLKGKRVFLNIWATWCGPCIQEMPSIAELQKQLSNKVEFLLASDENHSLISKFSSRPAAHGLKLIRLDNPEAFGINAIPVTFIFDEEGNLLHAEMGARDWSTDDSKKLVLD